nr:uncharacterized protein LOC113827842 [Penaeus vannamei]
MATVRPSQPRTSTGHLPGPIYGSGGYLDYAYGTGAPLWKSLWKIRVSQNFIRKHLGLAHPYGALRNVGVGGPHAPLLLQLDSTQILAFTLRLQVWVDCLLMLDRTLLVLVLEDSTLLMDEIPQMLLLVLAPQPVYKANAVLGDRAVAAGEVNRMIAFLVTVSAALLCSHAVAASSYLGLAQGTPLGGFSQHGTFHGGLIPSGLYGNGASLVNQGLPLGHLPGPIYGSGGYLDYAYGTSAHFGNPYGKSRFLKYLYGNPLGLANPYGALRNVGVGGVNEAEDETSASGSGATGG